LFSESPRTPKGEKGEEREKVKKKKEKGFDCSDWKPEAGLSPPRKKRGEEPKSRYAFLAGEKGLVLVTFTASSCSVCYSTGASQTGEVGVTVFCSAPTWGSLAPADILTRPMYCTPNISDFFLVSIP
jgi:hypothetical protein